MVRTLLAIACVVVALPLGSCGHQVTPDPIGSDLSGFVTVKFATAGAMDFTHVDYVIAIDTCGTGVPYPNAFNGGLGSFSFAFLVVGASGNRAVPVLEQYYLNPAGSSFVSVPATNLTPANAQFEADLNGLGSEFSLTFKRTDLSNPLQIPAPCPHASAYLSTWTFNLMTFPAGSPPGSAYDSFGPGGPNDYSFSGFVVDTTQTNAYPMSRAPTIYAPSTGSEDIVYGEVDTYR